jgi:hypothetical protein
LTIVTFGIGALVSINKMARNLTRGTRDY